MQKPTNWVNIGVLLLLPNCRALRRMFACDRYTSCCLMPPPLDLVHPLSYISRAGKLLIFILRKHVIRWCCISCHWCFSAHAINWSTTVEIAIFAIACLLNWVLCWIGWIRMALENLKVESFQNLLTRLWRSCRHTLKGHIVKVIFNFHFRWKRNFCKCAPKAQILQLISF